MTLVYRARHGYDLMIGDILTCLCSCDESNTSDDVGKDITLLRSMKRQFYKRSTNVANCFFISASAFCLLTNVNMCTPEYEVILAFVCR